MGIPILSSKRGLVYVLVTRIEPLIREYLSVTLVATRACRIRNAEDGSWKAIVRALKSLTSQSGPLTARG